nr:hypothetical protein [Tanacetum cinerariifolium]
MFLLRLYPFSNIAFIQRSFHGTYICTVVVALVENSTVTYTEVSIPFEDLSDIESPRVDGLPMMPEDPYAYVEAALQAPPSPEYVPGPEHPPSSTYVLEFVPEPVYPEFMPPENDVLLTEEQPLHVDVSPTADSSGYIPKFDLEEDPKEDPEEVNEDPEEDLADYPTDIDDDENEEEESSRDEADDEEEGEDEDEEEHPAPADSVLPPVHRVTARMSFRAQTPISLPLETEVARLLAIPTPPPSPLFPWSSPLPQILSPLPQIQSPPLPTSSLPVPASLTYPLGYRAAMIRLRAKSHRVDVLEVTLSPWKRLCITLGLRFKVSESSSAPTARPTGGFRADYEFVVTLDDEIWQEPGREVDFVTTIRHDTDEIYRRLNVAHDDRVLMSGQLNMLRRDRRAHACTARLMETEAKLSR